MSWDTVKPSFMYVVEMLFFAISVNITQISELKAIFV